MKTQSKLWILYFASAITMLAALTYVLLGLAPEASQGFAQKIFFFHVPAAFAMYGCLIGGAISAGLYLFERKKVYDQISRACVNTAALFSVVVITSGPIWARPIWGVWWTWDPRLTTSFVVFVLLITYCFVRKIFEESQNLGERGAIVGAIISILAAIDIPLIHYSVKLWRGVHPSVLANKEGLPPDYRQGLEFMVLAFLLLATLLIVIHFKLLVLQSRKKEIT